MLQPPSWQKDALPTGRGWAHPRTGELLQATRLSTADINDYLGIPKNNPVVISVEEAQEMIDIQPAHVTDPEMLVEEEAPDLSNMTKLEIETYGRTKGIELDRRTSKTAMINTLNEG